MLEYNKLRWHFDSVMNTVTVEDAKARFAELLDEARRGEEIVITEDEKPVAKLAPAPEAEPSVKESDWPLFGFLKGKILFHEGWDEPLEDMRPYME